LRVKSATLALRTLLFYQIQRRLIDSHRKLPFAVGPGCAVPVTVPDANIAAVRAAVTASVT